MKYLLSLFLFILGFSAQAQTDSITVTCHNCEVITRDICKNCDLKHRLFSGIKVITRRDTVLLYYPLKTKTYGNEISIEDPFGTKRQVPIRLLKGFGNDVDNFFNFLTNCTCLSGGNPALNTDTRNVISVVNDSLRIDIVDVITSSIMSTVYIDNVINKPDVVTGISYNPTNHTISYVNELGATTVLDLDVATMSFNATTNTLTYTAEDGTVTNVLLPVTSITSTIVGHQIGVFTNELGVTTPINETITTINNTQAGNTIATYTNENGTTVGINETITDLSVVNNQLTYTNESGTTVTYPLPIDSTIVTSANQNISVSVVSPNIYELKFLYDCDSIKNCLTTLTLLQTPYVVSGDTIGYYTDITDPVTGNVVRDTIFFPTPATPTTVESLNSNIAVTEPTPGNYKLEFIYNCDSIVACLPLDIDTIVTGFTIVNDVATITLSSGQTLTANIDHPADSTIVQGGANITVTEVSPNVYEADFIYNCDSIQACFTPLTLVQTPLIVAGDTIGYLTNITDPVTGNVVQDTIFFPAASGAETITTITGTQPTGQTIATYTNEAGTVVDIKQTTYQKCDGAALAQNDKVHQVQNLTRQTGFGVVKLDGVDCLAHNDERYDADLFAYQGSSSQGNTATNYYARVLNGQNTNAGGYMTIGGQRDNFSNAAYGLIFGRANNASGGEYNSIIGGSGNTLSANLGGVGRNTILQGSGNSMTGVGILSVILNGDANTVNNSHNFQLSGTTNNINNVNVGFTVGGFNIINNSVTQGNGYLCVLGSSNQFNASRVVNNNYIFGSINQVANTNILLSVGEDQRQYDNLVTSANPAYLGNTYSFGIGHRARMYGKENYTFGFNLQTASLRHAAIGFDNVKYPFTGQDEDGSATFHKEIGYQLGMGSGGNSTDAHAVRKDGRQVFRALYEDVGFTGAFTPAQTNFRSAFEFNTENSVGNAVYGGVRLAPMTQSQRNAMSTNMYQDGDIIYCKDCINPDNGQLGVYQYFQASSGSWLNFH